MHKDSLEYKYFYKIIRKYNYEWFNWLIDMKYYKFYRNSKFIHIRIKSSSRRNSKLFHFNDKDNHRLLPLSQLIKTISWSSAIIDRYWLQ